MPHVFSKLLDTKRLNKREIWQIINSQHFLNEMSMICVDCYLTGTTNNTASQKKDHEKESLANKLKIPKNKTNQFEINHETIRLESLDNKKVNKDWMYHRSKKILLDYSKRTDEDLENSRRNCLKSNKRHYSLSRKEFHEYYNQIDKNDFIRRNDNTRAQTSRVYSQTLLPETTSTTETQIVDFSNLMECKKKLKKQRKTSDEQVGGRLETATFNKYRRQRTHSTESMTNGHFQSNVFFSRKTSASTKKNNNLMNDVSRLSTARDSTSRSNQL